MSKAKVSCIDSFKYAIFDFGGHFTAKKLVNKLDLLRKKILWETPYCRHDTEEDPCSICLKRTITYICSEQDRKVTVYDKKGYKRIKEVIDDSLMATVGIRCECLGEVMAIAKILRKAMGVGKIVLNGITQYETEDYTVLWVKFSDIENL